MPVECRESIPLDRLFERTNPNLRMLFKQKKKFAFLKFFLNFSVYIYFIYGLSLIAIVTI